MACITTFNSRTSSLLVVIFCTFFLSFVLSYSCPNGCSSRGICLPNGVCQCAEGLAGYDCSTNSAYLPSPAECPTCYEITVGPAIYYYGPSWRLPDGPIVGLNNNGNLSVFQGNGNAEMLSQGKDVEDWEISSHVAMKEGTGYDECGAWLMRAIADGNKIHGFYHAERACSYNNNGQTRKAGGYAVSTDGGNTFTKPNYPNNKILDTDTDELKGRPSGEGDYGVTMKDNYYYMVFSNVEDDTFGIARATKASGGEPGTWYKYYNGSWNEPGVGGKHTALGSVTGTQVYTHTPSDSFITVGNRDAIERYYQSGSALSSSKDGINWKFLGDPLITGDFAVKYDTVLYQSFIGKTGGIDIGSNFDLYYMWIPPGETWTTRYQIRRSISLTYKGATPSTNPSTKIALTTYVHRVTGKRYETVEYAKYPFMPTKHIAYLMTRPYPYTFPLYECYNYVSDDHFVGTANECFASKVEALRVAGYLYAIRVARSVGVFRCKNTNDTFLSFDPNCEGKAASQSTPFGYVLQGPDAEPSFIARDIFVGQGQAWKFTNVSAPAAQGSNLWTSTAYNDSTWRTASAPFGTGYSSDIISTPFGRSNYYFRNKFTVASGRTLSRVVASIASDDYAVVYINGVMIDSDSTTHHEAAYWNRQVNVPLYLIKFDAPNVVAVLVRNSDSWAFFDMQLSARYTEQAVAQTPLSRTCGRDCGVRGQCNNNGECVCDNGFSGTDCSVPLCSFNDLTNMTVVSKGSVWRHTQWGYVPSTPANWFAPAFEDLWWHLSFAPFATSNYLGYKTWMPATRHLYRKTFLIDVPYGQSIFQGIISINSAANHRIWVNGVFLGTPLYPEEYHSAKYWSEVFVVRGSLFTESTNTIAVEVNPTNVAFFDLQVEISFATKTCVVDTTTAAAAATTTAAASTAAATTASATTAAASTSAAATSAAATTSAASTSAAATTVAASTMAASTSTTAAASTSAASTSAAATTAAASTSSAATTAAASTSAAAASTSAAATTAAASTASASTSAAATTAAASTSAAATTAAASTSAAATTAAASTSAAATTAAASTSAAATTAAASTSAAATTSAASTSSAATTSASSTTKAATTSTSSSSSTSGTTSGLPTTGSDSTPAPSAQPTTKPTNSPGPSSSSSSSSSSSTSGSGSTTGTVAPTSQPTTQPNATTTGTVTTGNVTINPNITTTTGNTTLPTNSTELPTDFPDSKLQHVKSGVSSLSLSFVGSFVCAVLGVLLVA